GHAAGDELGEHRGGGLDDVTGGRVQVEVYACLEGHQPPGEPVPGSRRKVAFWRGRGRGRGVVGEVVKPRVQDVEVEQLAEDQERGGGVVVPVGLPVGLEVRADVLGDLV